MNLKTLTGPSIHALLAEARSLFGDDVVLLESHPARDGQPARIVVMADQPAPAKQPRPAPATVPALALVEASVPEEEATTAPRPAGFGYRKTALLREEAAPASERFSRPTPRSASGTAGNLDDVRRPPAGRGRLFASGTPGTAPTSPADLSRLTDRLETRLGALEERLSRFEHHLGNAFVGMAHRWMGTPLYGHLLGKGLRPRTLTRLFERLTQDGFDPDDEASRLQWAAAHALRDLLNVTGPRTCATTQLFIGPSGSGKTALQLKLARNTRYLGRHQTTVIVIRPESEEELAYACPVELYRRFGLSVQSVGTPDEMEAAMERARRFSHLLIDTPSMPVRPDAARSFLARLHELTAPLAPLQVHLVLNASSVMDGFTKAFLERLPLRPDTLALTHMDEVQDPGRVAEALLALRLPVQFISEGPAVYEALRSYTPTWLVERIFEMNIVRHTQAPSAWDLL
ncbi:MAG: flagellar biosynthesis protein FlhF [Bacteroidetes bacterium]|nr:MAG: flagellar biosynthesis protein FlhF [Bacteroidota bacterium]